MKRKLIILTLLVFSILLTACKASDPENLFEATQEPEAEAVQTQPPADFVSEAGYQYGNMQKNVPSGNFIAYENAVLFFHHNILYTYDMSTGSVNAFCQDATCGHRTQDCAAYGADCNLEQADGILYAGHLGAEVRELKNGRFHTITDKGISHFWHGNGQLFAVTEDASLLAYDNGKPGMVLEEYTGFWETIFGDYLYFNSAYNVCRVNLQSGEKEILIKNADHITDGHHIYYAPEGSFCLYRCAMDGSNPELLLEQPVLPASWNFDDDYFYFRLYTNSDLDSEDGKILYRISKVEPTQVEEIAKLPAPIAAVYTVPGFEKLFVTLRSDEIYVVNRDGSNLQPLEFPEF